MSAAADKLIKYLTAFPLFTSVAPSPHKDSVVGRYTAPNDELFQEATSQGTGTTAGIMASNASENGVGKKEELMPDEVYDIERCIREGILMVHYVNPVEDERKRKLEAEKRAYGGMIKDPVPLPLPLMALNSTKAGMEGLDVDTINKTIHEASQGSKFYEHKRKQQEKIDRKIREIRCKLEMLTPDQIERAGAEVARLVEEIEAKTDLRHYYVHLDMDAFFAAVEIRDDPSLRDVPMAVGSESMLSTSNYLARRYGVRAAMPGFIARKLCPQIRIIPCNFKKYQEASRAVEYVLRYSYDPTMSMCMDEAELNITPTVWSVDEGTEDQMAIEAWEHVKEMREDVYKATQLTASAGIAPTRFLAKLCSDIRKPNGQCALACNNPRAIRCFLSAIPIRKVCGIGNVTEQMLKAIDIHTCKDLWDKRAALSLLFKRGTFQNLLGIAMGMGSTIFQQLNAGGGAGRKSLSFERTFPGTSDLGFLENLCRNISSELEKELQKENLRCKTITLKIKTTDYDVKTRARSIMQRTDEANKIFESAWKILMSYVTEIPDLTIRLMGVRVSNFDEKDGASAEQQTLHQFLKGSGASNGAASVSNLNNNPVPSTSKAALKANGNGVAGEEISEEYCRMLCPVCSMGIQAPTIPEAERLMDLHIDECLSRAAAREVRNENMSCTSPPKKRTRGSGGASSSTSSDAKKPKKGDALPINAYFPKL